MTAATWTDVAGVERPLTDQDRRDAAAVYAAMFAGRLDAYSAWTGSQWIAVREPLTPDVVIRAFTTKRPLSGYILAADSTTHLACLDVDTDDGLLLCDRVARAMATAGLPAYVEPSRRGAHLWCVLDRPVAGIVVRRALRAFLQAAGIPESPKIELRPGQDRLSSADGLGNALRMPLMPHQATGRCGSLLAPGGRIVAAKVTEAVFEVKEAPSELVSEWAGRYEPPPLDPRQIPSAYRKPRRHDEGPGMSASELLAQAGAVVRRVPGAIRCPFHDDTHPSLSIARNDDRVWCKQPACDAYNNGRGLGTSQLASLIRRRAAT